MMKIGDPMFGISVKRLRLRRAAFDEAEIATVISIFLKILMWEYSDNTNQ
jgi:hypothetical protein